jgi:YfiH family protein
VTATLVSGLLARCDRVAHGFWGRQGGVSQGIFASLNCGYGSDDDPALVRRNRGLVASALGADVDSLITAYQIHSADVIDVTAPWPREAAPRGDAMVTTVPGVALGVLAADCAPVLLADAQAGVIGSAHAGWQGAFAGVIEAVVARMMQHGAQRARIVAAVGPCISQASYEVGPEFHARFVAADGGLARFFTASARPGHFMFDLPSFVDRQLEAAGVVQREVLGVCTYKGAETHFSFRRTTHRGETHYGRNLSAIMLKP